jgi:hypothetical protein
MGFIIHINIDWPFIFTISKNIASKSKCSVKIWNFIAAIC